VSTILTNQELYDLWVTLLQAVNLQVAIAPPTTSPSTLQLTLTGGIDQLQDQACRAVIIENPIENSVVYVGDNAVTNLTGFRLWPGAQVTVPCNNSNLVYVTGTAADVISYLSVN
jgi:hypothetical protein